MVRFSEAAPTKEICSFHENKLILSIDAVWIDRFASWAEGIDGCFLGPGKLLGNFDSHYVTQALVHVILAKSWSGHRDPKLCRCTPGVTRHSHTLDYLFCTDKRGFIFITSVDMFPQSFIQNSVRPWPSPGGTFRVADHGEARGVGVNVYT